MPRNETASLFAEGAVGTLRLIAYLALAVTVMVIDHRGQYLTRLRAAGSLLVEPAWRLAAVPSELMRATQGAITAQSRLLDENRRLREALLLAQARLTRLDAMVAQNARLKALLVAQENLGLAVQLAHLVDVDLDPFRHRVVIDVGAVQGIRVGQPVIDAEGIMGQVVEVLPRSSVVLLITDPTHAIPVVVERSGLRAIAYGSGAIDRLELPNIPISGDIRVGDRLLTSGLGGRFPAGFPVGRIRTISNDDSGLFAAAVATPAAALDRGSEVLLLQDQPQPYGPPGPEEDGGSPAAAAADGTAPPSEGGR